MHFEGRRSHLTSPARLGRPPTEEATELTELMEELLGLWAREETPMAIRLLFLALAGLVEGKPMRITLWIGANRPNLGRHWKYLQGEERGQEICLAQNCFVIMLQIQNQLFIESPFVFSLGIQKGLLGTSINMSRHGKRAS